MFAALTQQNFPNPNELPAIFSSDPAGVKERPANGYYNSGVDVGYTAPAKWWNWLWNYITTWLKDSHSDKNLMYTELMNTLSAGSVSAVATKHHQLSEAVDSIAYNTTEAYDNETVTEEIGGVMVTHAKNKPYVVGHTVYYPDTELL